MGFRFMQRTGCNDEAWVAGPVDRLSALIKWQSRLDFRVVDVYLQRVLMQLGSGYPRRVNPRWVVRILEAQLADGEIFSRSFHWTVGAQSGFTTKESA